MFQIKMKIKSSTRMGRVMFLTEAAPTPTGEGGGTANRLSKCWWKKFCSGCDRLARISAHFAALVFINPRWRVAICTDCILAIFRFVVVGMFDYVRVFMYMAWLEGMTSIASHVATMLTRPQLMYAVHNNHTNRHYILCVRRYCSYLHF